MDAMLNAQVVLEVFQVTLPFFALVLCGFVAAYKGWLPLEAIPALNGFVLYFALPCMLFRFGASTPIAQLLDAHVALTYAVCAALMVVFAMGVSLSRRIGWNDASFGALVAAFPNTGFMGVPLLVALMGPHAVGPVIVTILVDMVLTSSVCIASSRLDGADEHGAAKAMRAALLGVLKNPMPWAISIGAVFSWQSWQLLAPVEKTVFMLADAASPVALFTIGAVLARSRRLARASKSRTETQAETEGESQVPDLEPVRWTEVLPVVLMKIVLHPVLVALVGASLMQWGVPLPMQAYTVLVLVAALPSASNVSLLAERFGANNGRIASIILLSTVLAFFSFSALVAFLRF